METTNIIQQINLSDIQSSNFINHRKRFSENELMELADSIKRNGVLQAILLRPSADSGYEIIFGERRYKAAFLAGLNAIPAVVREISDEEAMEIAWVENVKRQDITPLEEADFYQKLLATGRYDIASLCTQLGKNEAYIRIRLKLNSLIIEFKELLENEVLNIGTAFELAKYTEVQQENTYNDHYKEENSMQSWRGFPTKEIITRLKNVLTCKLDSYNFDKTDCYRCSSNTNNQSLFPIEGECGSCSNLACLKIKNTRFLVDRAKAITGSNPHLQICRQHYQFNEEAVNQLETEGYTVTPTDYLPQYPIAPVQPLPEDYENTDDYNADLNEYNTEYDEYKGSIDRDGNTHIVEYDEVFSLILHEGEELQEVLVAHIWRTFDGFIWKSKELYEQNYPHHVFIDMINAIMAKKSKGKAKKNISKSAGIKCAHFNYLGMFNMIAGAHVLPLIFNNTCWSWQYISESFLAAGIRGYVGTIWAVNNEVAKNVAETFYDNLFQTTVLDALQKSLSHTKGQKDENIYMYWGVHFTKLNKGVSIDNTRQTIAGLLMKSYSSWTHNFNKTNNKDIKENIRRIMNFISNLLFKDFRKE